jgi:lipopolysaccharide heptosyltransferase II
MRILINALSGIGDAIMFSPALSVLKKHIPEAQIDILVMFKQVEDIYKNNRKINRTYFIDFLGQSKLKSLKDVINLRKNKYDIIINVYPSNRREYNLISYLIGAKSRLAHRYNHYSFSNFDFLNTDLKQEIKDRHNVLENFDLIKLIAPDAKETDLDGYELFLDENSKHFAEKYLFEKELNGKFLAGFHAGSATFKRHINKRWSTEKYADLAKRLNQKYGVIILLFGTETDVNERIHNLAKEITHIPDSKNILESLALMEKCEVFVSNDTALMHFAAALKIPTVAVFAYTNHRELHPWMNPHIIVRKELECSPCFFNSPRAVKCIWKGKDEFKCIKTIAVDEVFEAAEKLIQEVPGNVKS